jgi:hypothetical protein
LAEQFDNEQVRALAVVVLGLVKELAGSSGRLGRSSICARHAIVIARFTPS